MGLAAFVIYQIFPRELVLIFGAQDGLYLDFAERYLRIHMLTVGLSGVQPLSAGYFNGTGACLMGFFSPCPASAFFFCQC